MGKWVFLQRIQHIVCLICNEAIAVMKEYNVCTMELNVRATGCTPSLNDCRTSGQWQLACKLNMFFLCTNNTAECHNSQLSHQTACPTQQTVLAWWNPKALPHQSHRHNVHGKSKEFVWRREDLLANMKQGLAIAGTVQLVIFLQAVDNICNTLELLDRMSTTDKLIFEVVLNTVEKMGLKWDKRLGVTSNGAPAMAGEQKVMHRWCVQR